MDRLSKIIISDNRERDINSDESNRSVWDSKKNPSRTMDRETEKAIEKLVKKTLKGAAGIPFQQLKKEIAARRRANDTRPIPDIMASMNRPLIEKKYNGYHGIDLMTLSPFNFDPYYKNPCWSEGNTLRCLPYFYVIGVKKCGTTDLWKKITQHPDFAASSINKEAQWFARRRFYMGSDSFETYIDDFKAAAIKIRQTYAGETFHQFITGEASPSNLHLNSDWRYLPGNEGLDEPKYVILDYIHHFLPEAKIIILFRDPVQRLYSDYYYQYSLIRKLKTSPGHFHELMVMGLQLYKECLQNRTLRSCVYDERIYDKVGIHIQLGIYHVYWKELTRLFPRGQILVLQNRDLQDSNKTMHKVFAFLNMRYSPRFQNQISNNIGHFNSRRLEDARKGDMLHETRRLLQDFYRPHNEEMFRITGDKRFLYSTTAS